MGAAQLGRVLLVSFVGFDRCGSGVFGPREGLLSYYSMSTPDETARGRPDAAPGSEPPRRVEPEEETCDICGSTDLWWRNCKLLCRRCQSIVKSCADL